MSERLTWAEMKQRYPNQWLLIVDYETDTSGHVLAGVVERHGCKDEVYRLPAVDKNCAFKYTGESTFPGGWRAHVHCDHSI